MKKLRRLVIATPPLAGEAISLHMDQWVRDCFVVPPLAGLLAMTQKGFFNKTFRFAKPRLKSEINLFEKKIQITNRLGLHARPAVLVVQLANKFKSEIKLEKEGVEVNAKSIMGVMMLAAEKGSFLLIKAEGEDEKEATEKLAELFDSKFGED